MKTSNVMLGLALAGLTTFGIASTTNAQDMQEQPVAVVQNDQVEEISPNDLPAPVAEAWDAEKAEGDEVSKIYKITSADGTVRYRIEYVDGSSQSQFVEYDADGNEL